MSSSGKLIFQNPMTTPQDLIVGGTAGEPTRLAKGSNGQYLRVNGSGVLEYVTLPVDPGFANPMTTAQDIILAGSGGTPGRLAKGANSTLLGVNSGGNVAYRKADQADISLAWTTFTVANVFQGNNIAAFSTSYARYLLLGKLALVRLAVVVTNPAGALAGWSFGVSLPTSSPNLTPINYGYQNALGIFHFTDSGLNWQEGTAVPDGTFPQNIIAYAHGSVNVMGINSPAVTLAVNDVISLNLMYEVA